MESKVTLAHGNGGRLMHELIDRLCVNFSNKILNEKADAADLGITITDDEPVSIES